VRDCARRKCLFLFLYCSSLLNYISDETFLFKLPENSNIDIRLMTCKTLSDCWIGLRTQTIWRQNIKLIKIWSVYKSVFIYYIKVKIYSPCYA
jgi:hypothetical protein